MGRTWVIAIVVLIVGNIIGAGAQEHNDQWCAYFSGGLVNCEFATFEECLSAIHGKTGLCQQYPPPAGPNPGSGNIHRRHSRPDAQAPRLISDHALQHRAAASVSSTERSASMSGSVPASDRLEVPQLGRMLPLQGLDGNCHLPATSAPCSRVLVA
jgi:hypothetical protein